MGRLKPKVEKRPANNSEHDVFYYEQCPYCNQWFYMYHDFRGQTKDIDRGSWVAKNFFMCVRCVAQMSAIYYFMNIWYMFLLNNDPNINFLRR